MKSHELGFSFDRIFLTTSASLLFNYICVFSDPDEVLLFVSQNERNDGFRQDQINLEYNFSSNYFPLTAISVPSTAIRKSISKSRFVIS